MCVAILNTAPRRTALIPPQRRGPALGFRRAAGGVPIQSGNVPPASSAPANNRNVCSVLNYNGRSEIVPNPVYPEIECSAGQSSGGQGEESYNVILGTDGGTVTLSYDAYSVPDRFTVTYNGVVVIDTGYVGDEAYAEGLPISGPGSGTASFIKPTGGPTFAVVTVYAPLAGTAWEFNLGCPQPL